MFEIGSISTSTEFQPFEEPESEVTPVELVTELVKVELQEFSLYAIVDVEDAPFGIADSDMHPRQDLARFLLAPSNHPYAKSSSQCHNRYGTLPKTNHTCKSKYRRYEHQSLLWFEGFSVLLSFF